MNSAVELSKQFDKLKSKMKNSDFQNNAGLSNEVGYYIFSYDARQELTVRSFIEEFQTSMTIATCGFNIKVFNIYDIMLKIIDRFNYREAFFKMEKEDGLEEVIKQINNILEMSENQNVIVKYVLQHLDDQKNIIFFSGVGQVYPILRAHTILNTMSQIIDKFPVVMFYPGDYDGLSLKAFGEVLDNNYYRAFSIQ